eukprot:scaffold21896_cov22-Tisochrysis_lutea.AAC.2
MAARLELLYIVKSRASSGDLKVEHLIPARSSAGQQDIAMSMTGLRYTRREMRKSKSNVKGSLCIKAGPCQRSAVKLQACATNLDKPRPCVGLVNSIYICRTFQAVRR